MSVSRARREDDVDIVPIGGIYEERADGERPGASFPNAFFPW
jgi:hypothetical protein